MTLLTVSIALLAGLLMTRVFKPFKLPAVTAYLIAGILVGPYFLGKFHMEGIGFTSMENVLNFSLIAEVALGFIAFSIGNEFRLEELRHTGKQAAVIGIFQALSATLCVDFALIGLHIIMPDRISMAQAITLGAIATATAPAATLMVVRQYKARGPLTDLLLPIVALDDAIGLIVFAISFGIARTMVTGNIDVVSIIINPLVEIIASVLLGALMGWFLTCLEKMFNSNTNRLNMTIAFVLLTVALSNIDFYIGVVHVTFSSLLVCMMLGTVFCNICPLSYDIMEASDKWTSPLLALFFVISGAELELAVFGNISIVFIGLTYILIRCIGKYAGSYLSAKAMKCEANVYRNLGITLFPQAGVALGMCSVAMQLGEDGVFIQNITLFAVLIYEIFGPFFTKQALIKAGDIKPIPEEVIRRRQTKLEQAKKLKKK